MKYFLSQIFLMCLLTMTSSAQWVQQAGFPGQARSRSTAFSIGTKIYLMGGYAVTGAVLKDVWEYNTITNTWLQKNTFPGEERYGATSWVVNGFGYVATGANDFGYLDDMWKYDPTLDTWTQRTGLPVTTAQHENQRREAFSFVIGTKAYLGGGEGFVFTPNSTFNYAFFDLWEFDIATNAWTLKSGIPDNLGRNMSVAAAIGNKAYVGLGCNVDQNVNRQSFWEYDGTLDTWSSKADFPNLYTTDAGTFVLDSNVYVIGGVNLNPVALSNQFYRYSPDNDTWTQLPDFNGGAIAGTIAISQAGDAFVGTGFTSSLNTRADWWKLSSATTGFNHSTNPDFHVGVFPNPANEFFSVESSEKIGSLELYNQQGVCVKKLNESFNRINIESLSAGIYTLQLTTLDGKSMRSLLVKE